MEHLRGEVITSKSFEIIKDRLGEFTAPAEELEIVVRIAHTTGDVEFAKTFHFREGAVRRGIEALKRGGNVITDVEMVRTGIRRSILDELGGGVHCFLNNEDVRKEAETAQATRSALGMRKATEPLRGGIAAVGNAPTALYELMDLIRRGETEPALIVGVPVGFVGALESKEALYETELPCITNLSERGGSTIAAAIVNGLLHLAQKEASR